MSLNQKTIKSYAKINFGLKVLDLLPDTYHSIFTIMQEIDFYDYITISKTKDSKINLEINGPISIPADGNNSCIKAAKLLYDNYSINKGINIKLTKNIPTEAGLGGGSSNAANTLSILNNIFELNINNHELEELAIQLGCDVPFFINGGTQICEGKGEKLTKLSAKFINYTMLLVFPKFSVSTQWAYSFFKNDLPKRFDSDKFRSFQDTIDWKLFDNDFENIIKLTYPEVIKIRNDLESTKALFVSLSGSGSTMYGVFDDFLKASSANQALKSYNCRIVKPINRI